MKALEALENGIQKVFGPAAQKVGSNKVLQAVGQGCLATVPITIGVALTSILVNLTIPGWEDFLQSSGLYAAGQEAISVTMSLLALYLVFTVSYSYSKIRGYHNLMAAVLALAAFLIMVPSTVTVAEDQTITALTADYLGSNGIFVALFTGILVSAVYCTLMDKGVKLKMPKTVPTMVADSISSCLPAILIITGALIIKWLFTFTSFGNVFTLIVTILQKPFMSFGTSPMSFIIFSMFCNLIWFCGIHPSAITSVYLPVIIGAIIANIEAFAKGEVLPYAGLIIVYLVCNIGGNGCTLGFSFATFLAKSEKFKAMRKIIVVPNIFNINEPIIFGVPLMLNPLYFIPMVFSPLVNGLVGWGIFNLFGLKLNPALVLAFPWVTPGCIVDFAVGGIILCITWFLCVGLDFLLYLPFTLLDDKNAQKEEARIAETLQAE